MRAFPAIAAAVLALGCAKHDYTRLYHDEPRAPSIPAAEIERLEHLGPTIVDRGVNFGVYSEHATKIELLLFDDPESERATRQFDLTRFGDVWNVYVEGIGVGQHYGFVAWGPNWPYLDSWHPGQIDGFLADVDGDGNRFDPNKLLMDPYAKAYHRDHDWSKGSIASGPKRAEADYAGAAKSVVVKSSYVWSAGEAAWQQMRQDPRAPGHGWNDLVIYEMHPKGFTASAASGVAHPGTFRGVAEKADYLADLGVNAVELLPVMEKPLDGGYWGYQTIGFFAPEVSYAVTLKDPYPLDEFKAMVDALHQRGIEVILDVVYNHTGEGGFWREKLQYDDAPKGVSDELVNYDPKEVAGLYSLRGLDNAAYYALTPDNQFYVNHTGVGNESRPNWRPLRRLILDSLHYWSTEMHVDGFRFDLAPILGERDKDYDNWDDPRNTVLQDVIDDPLLQASNTRIIAEPWSAGGNYGVKVGSFPSSTAKDGDGWYEWNGAFRDNWRAFENVDSFKLSSGDWTLLGKHADMGFVLAGSYDWYGPGGRRPYHSVNFTNIHDGFTMYDLFSYDTKQNKCGPLNPVCCEQPLSPFCDHDSGETNNRSRDWGQSEEPQKRQLMRGLFTAMMISHGTPSLLGGDEWARTQLGNNNAYSTRADNPYNWFDWGVWQAQDERWRMHDFVRSMVRFRKDHAYAFAPENYGAGAPFKWKSEQGLEPPDWSSKHLMIHYDDATRGAELALLINFEATTVSYKLPPGRSWVRLLDTQQYFDSPDYLTQNGLDPRQSANATLDSPAAISTATYDVPQRTIVVLEAR